HPFGPGVGGIRGFPDPTIDSANIKNIGVRWMSHDSVNGPGDLVRWWRVGLGYAASLRSRSDRLPGSPNNQLTRRQRPVGSRITRRCLDVLPGGLFVRGLFEGFREWTVEGRVSQREAPGDGAESEIHRPEVQRLPGHLALDLYGVWSGFEDEFRAGHEEGRSWKRAVSLANPCSIRDGRDRPEVLRFQVAVVSNQLACQNVPPVRRH